MCVITECFWYSLKTKLKKIKVWQKREITEYGVLSPTTFGILLPHTTKKPKYVRECMWI